MLTWNDGTLTLDTRMAEEGSIRVECHASGVGYEEWYLLLAVESDVDRIELGLLGIARLTISMPDGSVITCRVNTSNLERLLITSDLSATDKDALAKTFPYRRSMTGRAEMLRSKDGR